MCWLCRRDGAGRLAADDVEDEDEADTATEEPADTDPQEEAARDAGRR